MNISRNIKIWKPTSPTTNIDPPASTHIDLQNWDGCLFLLVNATSHLASTGVCYIQQTTGTSTDNGWTITTTGFRVGSTYRITTFELTKPLRRYVRLKTLTATGVQIIPITYSGRMVGTTELLSAIHPTSAQPAKVYCGTS
jgi:hypothetical protein